YVVSALRESRIPLGASRPKRSRQSYRAARTTRRRVGGGVPRYRWGGHASMSEVPEISTWLSWASSSMSRRPPLQYQATATTQTVMTVTLAKAVAGGVVLGLYSRLTGTNRNENQCRSFAS